MAGHRLEDSAAAHMRRMEAFNPQTRSFLVSPRTGNWTDADRPVVDSTLAAHGLVVSHFAAYWLAAESAKPIDLFALRRRLDSSLLGVRVQRNSIIGAASDIRARRLADGVELTFQSGWGDCPSGCTYRHEWVFAVSHSGRVILTASRGDPIDPLPESELCPFGKEHAPAVTTVSVPDSAPHGLTGTLGFSALYHGDRITALNVNVQLGSPDTRLETDCPLRARIFRPDGKLYKETGPYGFHADYCTNVPVPAVGKRTAALHFGGPSPGGVYTAYVDVRFLTPIGPQTWTMGPTRLRLSAQCGPQRPLPGAGF